MNEARDRTILMLRERRTQLDSARVAALERLNCILGGIAEMDYLIQQLEAAEEVVVMTSDPGAGEA